ncbi:MAG TPA: aromatic acid exporter family protein [Terriglobales bacterium]
MHKSRAASFVRVLANLISVNTGVIVSMVFPHGPAAVAVSLVVVILLCELLRLDLGLRSACASLLIVTLSPDPALLHRGEQGTVEVIVGCGIALLLQLALYWAGKQRHTAAAAESE